MRIGIYNRYWNTRGGGERYAGIVAEALARLYDVELTGVGDVDLEDISEHLGLDLSGLAYRRWPSGSERDLVPLTAGYDLFLNSTYLSRLGSRARRSAYLVLFPQRVLSSSVMRPLERSADRFDAMVAPSVLPLEGFFDSDLGGCRWSGEQALLRIPHGAFEKGPVRLSFEPLTPWPLDQALQRVAAPGLEWRLEGDELVLERLAGAPEPAYVELTCRLFRPVDHGISPDGRELGVCLRSSAASKPKIALRWLADRFRGYLHSRSSEHLDCYQLLIAISDYTQQWITKRWRRSSVVLEPPLDGSLFAPCRTGPKETVILSVGRFFYGSHNKKHLELLRVFRRMCDRGEIPDGWEYHLVGNLHRNKLADLEYFAALERLAQGYPVKLLADQPLSSLLAEYRRASIFWHASGWGESDLRHPERFEHFGLTTCEAMCSGCIPVVIAKAGQLEIVTPGESGFLFSSAGELAATTWRLIQGHGEPWVEAMRVRAARAAERFERGEFERRLLALLHEHGLLERGVRPSPHVLT